MARPLYHCEDHQTVMKEPHHWYELPVRKSQAVLNFGILEYNCSSRTGSFKYYRPPSIRPRPAKYYFVFYSIKKPRTYATSYPQEDERSVYERTTADCTFHLATRI
jgi:hypothetical protein